MSGSESQKAAKLGSPSGRGGGAGGDGATLLGGCALGAEVTMVLIALSLLERHGADPVEKRGVVQRIGDRGERAVATGFAVEPGIGVDVEFPLPGLTLLLGLVHEAA